MDRTGSGPAFLSDWVIIMIVPGDGSATALSVAQAKCGIDGHAATLVVSFINVVVIAVYATRLMGVVCRFVGG